MFSSTLNVRGEPMIFKRVFSKKVSNVTKSIRMPEAMADALQVMAEEAGESLNSYVVLVLDDYLQRAAAKPNVLELIADDKIHKES